MPRPHLLSQTLLIDIPHTRRIMPRAALSIVHTQTVITALSSLEDARVSMDSHATMWSATASVARVARLSSCLCAPPPTVPVVVPFLSDPPPPLKASVPVPHMSAHVRTRTPPTSPPCTDTSSYQGGGVPSTTHAHTHAKYTYLCTSASRDVASVCAASPTTRAPGASTRCKGVGVGV